VSRTALGSDSAHRLGDDRGDGLIAKCTGALTSPIDDGIELFVGQDLKRAVDFLEACARGQEQRQDFVRELLTLGLGQGLDFRDERLDLPAPMASHLFEK